MEYWNFQHMLDFWVCEASQNLSSFRQLFFHSFQRTKGKIAEKLPKPYTVFSAFLLWSPLGNYEKQDRRYSEPQAHNKWKIINCSKKLQQKIAPKNCYKKLLQKIATNNCYENLLQKIATKNCYKNCYKKTQQKKKQK